MLKPIVTIIAIVLLTACNAKEGARSGEINNHIEESSMEMGNTNNAETNTILTPIIDNYLQLKNALVKDNSKDAAKAGKLLYETFKGFDKSKIEKSKLKEYNEIVEDAKEHVEHISKNADNIEHQREHFEMLSTDISDLITLLGTDRTLYVDKCPMYNEGKGGKWISETKEIKNPYYGSEMMKCGSVISTIK